MHEERQIAALVQPDTIGCMFVCQVYVWISVAAVPKDVSSEQFVCFFFFFLFFMNPQKSHSVVRFYSEGFSVD